MNGNKFKANTVLAIKLARAVYYMLRQHTVFDPDRLVAALTHNDFGPGGSQPGRLTGADRGEAHTSHRPETMSLEHRRSALGTAGLRRFDWELLPRANSSTAGARAEGSASPRLL